MHKKFLNTFKKLREEVGEDRDSFMQKALKVCKTFKVKSLKTPKLDKLPTKTACILFYIDMEGKKELKLLLFLREVLTYQGNQKSYS